MLREDTKKQETYWQLVIPYLTTLPLPSAVYVPSPWQWLRGEKYLRPVFIFGLAAAVLICSLAWLGSVTHSDHHFVQDIEQLAFEDEVPLVVAATQPLPAPQQNVPKDASELFCDKLRASQVYYQEACGGVDYATHTVCLFDTNTVGPKVLRDPSISHRHNVVDVEELDPRCAGQVPRRTVRHRQISVLYKTFYEEPAFIRLENAYCLQRLVEELALGRAPC